MKMEEYIGKEVMIYEEKCYVAACDRELGITLHSFTTGEEIFCLNRKQFVKKNKYCDFIRNYHKVFSEILNQIRHGKVSYCVHYKDSGEIIWYEKPKIAPTGSMTCAFK